MKKMKWRWTGHILQRNLSDVERQAFEWNPQGARKIGGNKYMEEDIRQRSLRRRENVGRGQGAGSKLHR